MALQKTITTVNGIVVDNAYHRVEDIAIGNKTTLNFSLASYVNQDKQYPAFQRQMFCVEYDMNGKNPFVQAYTYVKTLPEFAGAKDC